MRRNFLICLFANICQVGLAFPCQEIGFKFVLENETEILPSDIYLEWAYNEDCGNDEARSEEFVVELMTIFDEELVRDTVKGFRYSIEKRFLTDPMGLYIFQVRELGDNGRISIALKMPRPMTFRIPDDPINRLNLFLLNGYFLNALAELKEMGREDLFEGISSQLNVLFPANYPDRCDFFNSYFSDGWSGLVTMPFVTGLNEFEANLNKRTKAEYLKGSPFTVELLISADNQIIGHRMETSHEALILELAEDLTFSNQAGESRWAYIKIGVSENGRRYEVLNQRALTDPNSIRFRKKYQYKGPIN